MIIRHKLVINSSKINTLCGIKCIAFYPQTNKIMNEDNAILYTTFEDEEVNCIACEKHLLKDKSNGTPKERNFPDTSN